MSKLVTDPITENDLEKFISSQADFSFEMQVLKLLTDLGFQCDHGGTYDDPATGKPREFDIRAIIKRERKCILRLAVECKNVRENFPLLVSCLPRRKFESFFEVMVSVDPDEKPFPNEQDLMVGFRNRSQSVQLTGINSLYRKDGLVGKSCEQVGRSLSDSKLISTDSGIFDKWSQAISSAHDLVIGSCDDGKSIGMTAFSVVIPILVIPNERLWVVSFNEEGVLQGSPGLTDRCSYYVNREYFCKRGMTHDEYCVSHLEMVTLNGLAALAKKLSREFEDTFPMSHIINNVAPELFK